MRAWIAVLALGVLAGCVSVDPDTGKPIPRGEQRFPFDTVTRNAESLLPGMSKSECLMLLGSPAERSADGDTWVYLPERPAVLIPGRALRLRFADNRLAEHGYRAIILGQDL